jgi:hypothetical protein
MDDYLPENQFGFRRGRSTIQAMRNLAEDNEAALRELDAMFYRPHESI